MQIHAADPNAGHFVCMTAAASNKSWYCMVDNPSDTNISAVSAHAATLCLRCAGLLNGRPVIIQKCILVLTAQMTQDA